MGGGERNKTLMQRHFKQKQYKLQMCCLAF